MSYKEATIGTCILGDGEQTDTLRVVFQERVDVRVARIFNTFGPRMHMADGRVVSNFILQALQNEPITVSRLLHAVSSCWGCSCLYGGGANGYRSLPNNPSPVLASNAISLFTRFFWALCIPIPVCQQNTMDTMSLHFELSACVNRFMM